MVLYYGISGKRRLCVQLIMTIITTVQYNASTLKVSYVAVNNTVQMGGCPVDLKWAVVASDILECPSGWGKDPNKTYNNLVFNAPTSTPTVCHYIQGGVGDAQCQLWYTLATGDVRVWLVYQTAVQSFFISNDTEWDTLYNDQAVGDCDSGGFGGRVIKAYDGQVTVTYNL